MTSSWSPLGTIAARGGGTEYPPTRTVEVIELLTRLGLLSPSEIVAEGLVVRDVSRRNRVYLVEGAIRVAVKMPGSEGPAHSVAREWRALAWLAVHRPGLGPPVLAWDPQYKLLVTRLLDGASLAQYVRRPGQLPTGFASQLGTALGTLHAGGMCPPFASAPAGALRLHRLVPAMLGHRTRGQLELIRMLQRAPAACASLDAAARAWLQSAAIHGDVRWEHVVVSTGPGVEHLAVRFVDWEFSGSGDPCWDIGCAIAGAVRDGLVTAAVAAGSTFELLVGADLALVEAAPAMSAMWSAWEDRMGQAAIETRERVMSLVGARLLQFADEIAGASTRLEPPAALTARVGIDFLERPREAAEMLLAGDRTMEHPTSP